MSTFVYAPGIRIFIKTENNGTIDVSDDIVDYTVQRRSDGPSTANFSVQNVQRKYDGVFSPNDEVIIELKRVTWVRVFTGLLNSVPLVTMWPRVVAFSASCSLKRLQYWYWDPQLATSWTEATNAMTAGSATADSGITNVILSLLKDVVGWDPSKAHIGAIPQNWFRLALPYAQTLADQLVSADAQVTQMMAGYGGGTVGGTAVNGVVSSTGGSITTQPQGIFKNPVSLPTGEVLSQGQLSNAESIIRAGKNIAGVTDRDIIGAIATAIQESRLHETSASPSGTYVGLFQQSPGWGYLHPPSMRTNPTATAQAYFNLLLSRYPDRASMSLSQQMAKIEGYSGNSGANAYSIQGPLHDRFIGVATELVNGFNTATNTGSVAGDVNTTAAASLVAPTSVGQSTAAGGLPMAQDFLAEALNLVATFPTIRYGSPSLGEIKAKGVAPSHLGCSSFVSWVLYNKMGTLPQGWNYEWAEDQFKWCLSHGGKEMSVAEAMVTQGALLIRHPGYQGQAEGHVEISVGNGVDSVGATNPSQFASRHSAYPKQFQTAVTMPLFDYSQAKNGTPPTVYVGGSGSSYQGSTFTTAATEPYSSTSGFDSTNPIDQLFGGLIAPAQDPQQQLEESMALAFTGPRALLNDQPLLPYLKNLINASMRSFCSAPNGDFMAWFPDYYGLWGTAAIMVVEPIELQDFYVEWTDDYFVTHQYTVAGTLNYLDGFSGAIQTTFTPSSIPTGTPFSDARLVTAGIASIDIPAIMYALFGISLTGSQGDQFRQYIYRKFGARPDFKEMDGMVGKTAELFSAMYYFMRQWSYQYNANIPLTFMPELWPGMLIQIPEYDFQAYVTAVTHSGQMGEGGGHTTSVNVAAPSRLPDGSNTHHLIGLPIASGMLQANANVVTPVDSGMVTQAQKNARQAGGG